MDAAESSERSGVGNTFLRDFEHLTGHAPFRWQERLFARFAAGDLPGAIDLPTGLGKTSVMAIWLLARAVNQKLPRRLVYVVECQRMIEQAKRDATTLARHSPFRCTRQEGSQYAT